MLGEEVIQSEITVKVEKFPGWMIRNGLRSQASWEQQWPELLTLKGQALMLLIKFTKSSLLPMKSIKYVGKRNGVTLRVPMKQRLTTGILCQVVQD